MTPDEGDLGVTGIELPPARCREFRAVDLPGDGRSSFAALTPAGRDALRRAWPVYREAIRRHLAAGLTREQCRDLAALLDQIIKASETSLPLTS
jgi:hypothetical protein